MLWLENAYGHLSEVDKLLKGNIDHYYIGYFDKENEQVDYMMIDAQKLKESYLIEDALENNVERNKESNKPFLTIEYKDLLEQDLVIFDSMRKMAQGTFPF